MSRPAWPPPWSWPGSRGVACPSWMPCWSACHGVPAGRILIRRAGVFYILGRNAEALRDAQAAVDLLTGAGDLVWEARALHWRAAVYLAMGDIQRADQDYARAEALWVECAQQLEYADTRATNAGWPPMPVVTCPPRSPTSTTPRCCSTSWGFSPPNSSSTSARCCSPLAWCTMPCSRPTRPWPGSSGSTARRPGAPSWSIPPPSPRPQPATSGWRRSAVMRRCGCSGGSSARGGRRGRSSPCCCAGSGTTGIRRRRCCLPRGG